MAIGPADFMRVAEEALQRDALQASEIEVRNSISRAYYSAYTYAVEMLPRLDIPLVPAYSEEGGSHARLASSYRKGGKSLTAIADMLAAAHKLRCYADYHCNEKVDRAIAVKQLAKCKGVSSRLDQINAAILGTTSIS